MSLKSSHFVGEIYEDVLADLQSPGIASEIN